MDRNLLDDMEKYDNKFDRSTYEHLPDEVGIPIFRAYYDRHLPVDVTTWIRVNTPDENLIYKSGLGKQVHMIRDLIMRNIFYDRGGDDLSAYRAFQPNVVGTHCSKSVLLPVMEINLQKYDIILTLRNNFYNWNISVESENEVLMDHKGIINDDSYDYCFCEGFDLKKKFGKYEDNKKQFTICIVDDYSLYTFMYLLKDWLIHK